MKLKWKLVGVVAASLFAATVSPASAELTGLWRLNEGSGDVVANEVAGGASGTIFNGATGGLGAGGAAWASDPVRGNVVSFNGLGTGAWIAAGEIPKLSVDTDFSWAFWAKQEGTNADPNLNDIIVGNRYNSSGADFAPRQFIKFTPSKFEWHGNATGENLDYDSVIPAGEWMHHAVVKDGDSLTYYRNGSEATSRTITLQMDFPMPLNFGGGPGAAAGENWSGFLSEVRTYDHALSAGEVAALVPEPSSVVLLLAGLLGATMIRRKQN